MTITPLIFFPGGMALHYTRLPEALRVFGRVHPITSANASMIFLLEGENYIGYNPLGTFQACTTAALSLLILIMGMIMYENLCWRR
jgi:hypothetical protein